MGMIDGFRQIQKFFSPLLTIALLFLCEGQSIGQDDRAEIQKAIKRGDFDSAMQALGKMPVKQRIEWIDELAEIRPRSDSLVPGQSDVQLGGVEGNERLPGSGFEGGGNGRGGAAIADFRSLINLIETTIDGNWESDGGTNTISEFRSGVWIDSNGLVLARDLKKESRIGEKGQAKELKKGKPSDEIVLPDLGGWQTKSRFRWVSLRKLAEELEARRRGGKVPSMSMELVGGLAQIQAVSYDPSTKDWFLGGPAGGFQLRRDGELVQTETGLPPVLLEDLLSVAPQVFSRQGGFGCSIDPVQERLAAVQSFLQDPSNSKLLAKRPESWVEQVTEKFGPQKVTIYGLPTDSPSSLALLVADQHMKRVGLGLEQGPAGMGDYISLAEKLDSVPGQGLVRWWFAFSKSPIISNADGTHFELPTDSVCVLSDKEWMDANGKRSNGIGTDRAAEAFAKSFSKRFGELQKTYPVYGRLRHIFDLTIAMEIIHRSEHGLGDLDVFRDPTIQPRMSSEPEFVPTVATHRVLASKQIVAMVSGGVVVEPQTIASRIRQGDVTLRSVSKAVPVTSSGSKSSWMFDAD